MSPETFVPKRTRSLRPLDAAARTAALALLARMRDGRLAVDEGDGVREYGCGSATDPSAGVRVRSAHAYTLALRGGVGLARGYVDGLWDADDPAAVMRVLTRNLGTLDRVADAVHPAIGPLRDAAARLRANTRSRALRRVRAHYDLGNDLFASMLDETMSYSCAIFPEPSARLGEASTAKLDLACRKLGLNRSHHVVETGGGWGGFALHAAARYGCHVTTTTISQEQYDLALERVARAGLRSRVRVLLEDYRELRGRYDRLVSIEMIEAVGWQHLDTYMRQCGRLLHSDGAMFLQAIVASDRLARRWRSSRGLANSVVFPGGSIPSVEGITRSAGRAGDMRVVHLEDITAHYGPTLRTWRERFTAGSAHLDGRRYDRRFARLWEFYLAYCEAAFVERRINDVQMVLARPGFRCESVPALAARPGPEPALHALAG